YALRHGYDSHIYTGQDFFFIKGLEETSPERQTTEKLTDRSPNWAKVGILSNLLPKYDAVLWIDADAFIMRPDLKLEKLFPKGKDLYLAPDAVNLNCGVMFIRNTPWSSQLMDRWQEMGLTDDDWYCTEFLTGAWINNYEQGALNQLYFKNWNSIMLHTEIMPAWKINAHLQDEYWRVPRDQDLQYSKESFILHLAGIPTPRRMELIDEYL
ncbi:MAG: DUF273 domain-containing protein, partial [bacterium]